MPALPQDYTPGAPAAVPVDYAALKPLTTEPAYALPARLLDLLGDRLADRFGADELNREREFTRLCEAFHAVGVFLGQFVTCRLFDRPPVPALGPEQYGDLGWAPHVSRAVAQGAVREAGELSAPVHDRQEAYAGWLMTHCPYLAERDALRARRGRDVERLGALPSGRVQVVVQQLAALLSEPVAADEIAADFAAFYDRWQLSGLATWDLPVPANSVLGGPAGVAFPGPEAARVVQLPATLRLPARFPMDRVRTACLPPHLAGWDAVMRQRGGEQFNYARLRRALHLHFLWNVALAGAYGDRLHRRTGDLVGVFADYFGDRSEETVRKQRQWIARRLRAAPQRAQ